MIETLKDAVITVTGELVRIDFNRHVIVLRYPISHKEIECLYLEELEESLLKNRRQIIQVTGDFTLDADGYPTKLTLVHKIEPLDLSFFVIQEVFGTNSKLRFKTPLTLTPKMDEETNQLFVVEESDINLYVFAYTREDLLSEIQEQIMMMWKEYVLANEEDLATDAIQLRQKLQEQIEEVENAQTKG